MGELVARSLIALLFVLNGAATARDPEPRRAKAAWFGNPPLLAVRANGAAMVVLGLLLVTGWQRTWVASGLGVLLVLTTIGGHAFWRAADRAERGRELTQLVKNTAVLGGLLLLAMP
ncbi:DoxX family membrane protein [Nocardioides nitrophenolicus]|uniref:DoxX family membrane protein n=1 Tax=Nocardioides nitrophenolicus TaxID=60489 RepID=UPI00195632BB|nr:DoxX family membrane protein [Nocardioides nitrophenolicus]MBM7516889.1 putative membrane protein YphA (DoxX/SURF4 family) [Nocardioides nitrophenolicus]